MRPKTYVNLNKNLDNPGPGQYAPNYNVEHPYTEKFTMRPKTALLKPTENNPGPGQYSIDRDLKSKTYVFGKDQKCKPLNSEVIFNPGPDHYNVNDSSINPNHPKFSFGKEMKGNESMSKRPKTPGPGQYNFNEMFGKGPKYSMSFVKPDLYKKKETIPGPGQYDKIDTNKILEKAPQYR